MNEIFENLQCPFVFVDSSHAFRTNSNDVVKLTRNLMRKNPEKFWSLIKKIEDSGCEDTPYYEQIIQLQKRGIISSLITCEAVNQTLINRSTDVIRLFGTVNSMSHKGTIAQRTGLPDVVLWGEDVCYKTYIKATNALLNATCIVADKTILSLQIGQLLLQHTTQHCPVYFLSDRKKGGNHTEYDLPPKQFIQQLASVHQVTD